MVESSRKRPKESRDEGPVALDATRKAGECPWTRTSAELQGTDLLAVAPLIPVTSRKTTAME